MVAAMGSPAEAIESTTGLTWAGGAKEIADRRRSADSNKGRFGHVLVIGGARGKSGAPAMSSVAALRAGAGLVTAAVAESILPTVAAVTPELMTEAFLEGAHGEISTRNLEAGRLDPILEKKSVIAIGPGLGQQEEAVDFFLGLLERTKVPMVIDADALNALAAHPGKIDGHGRLLVLTPHPGEMARLAGMSILEVEADREGLARQFATSHGVTLVLKGWRTLIAHPDGRIAINTTGNPGMAKGGSGDILTGIVAAMLSQYPEQPAEAVEAAVYLHGLAADFAVRWQDQHTLLAMDSVPFRPSISFQGRGSRRVCLVAGNPRHVEGEGMTVWRFVSNSSRETIAIGGEIAQNALITHVAVSSRRPGCRQDNAGEGNRAGPGRRRSR